MVKKFLDWLKSNTTNEEFKEILERTTEDSKNNIYCNERTNAKKLINNCIKNLNLVRRNLNES